MMQEVVITYSDSFGGQIHGAPRQVIGELPWLEKAGAAKVYGQQVAPFQSAILILDMVSVSDMHVPCRIACFISLMSNIENRYFRDTTGMHG